jgi:hypothetical protein
LKYAGAGICFLIGLTLDVIAIPVILVLSPYLLYLLLRELKDYWWNETEKKKYVN